MQQIQKWDDIIGTDATKYEVSRDYKKPLTLSEAAFRRH